MLKMTVILALSIWVIAMEAFIQPAYAQINEFKITASDGAADDRFGNSVFISGDYAVVGAFRDGDNGDNSGSAYVFKRTGESWVEEAKLLASDGASNHGFGNSVSISGDYAVVGAFGPDAAYVFKRTGTSWTQQAKLLAAGHNLGNLVTISGDHAVVGASRGLNDNGTQSGLAYVFKRTGPSWVQEAKLLASDGAIGDEFGESVSISGDYAVVGAPEDNDNGSFSGSAYVFKRTGTSWVQEAKLLPSDGAAEDFFGISVSMSGDYALVGAKWDDFNTGSAYVFKRTGTSWTQEAKLLASGGSSGHSFGISVSISGDYAIVGARGDDDKGTNAGAAYLFKRNGTSWSQEAKLLASDGAIGDEFGESVFISGGRAIVGAAWNDDDGDLSGSAYLYSGITVGIEDERTGLPSEFSLFQNYPNPFNPVTVLRYALPEASRVSLIIYNLRGQEVRRWDIQGQPAGYHKHTWNASNISSGIYFYRLQAGDFVQTRKMVLLK